MKNYLTSIALMVVSATGFAQNARTAAEDAAAIAKAQADRLEYQVRAEIAQRTLDNAEKKAAADAEKTAQDAADKKLADAQAAKKAVLDLEKNEQELADKRQAALASASKALADMPSAAGVKDVAVTGTPIEAKTLTYRALAPIAKQLAIEIASSLPTPESPPNNDKGSFILADQITLDSLIAVQVAERSLARLAKKYESGVKEVTIRFGEIRASAEPMTKSGAGVVLALEGLKAVAAVVKTLQTTMFATPHDVTVDPLAMHAALAKAWRDNDKLKSVVLIAHSGLSVRLEATDIGKSMNELETTQDTSAIVESEIQTWLDNNKSAASPAVAQTAKTDAMAKPKAAASAPKPVPQSVIDEVSALLAKLKVANGRVSEVLTGLASTSGAQPVSPLTQLIRTSYIMKDLRAGASLLSVKVVAAGGNSLATNNLWVGSKLFHSGGAVVAYTVVNQHGNVVGGSVLDSHTGYLRLKRSDSAGLGNSWDTPPPAPFAVSSSEY